MTPPTPAALRSMVARNASPVPVELRRCRTCDGSGYWDDGEFDVPVSPLCPTCRGARFVKAEVRR